MIKRAVFSLVALWVFQLEGQPLTYSREGNTFRIKLREGHAEIEWISPSSFRFCRAWSGAGQCRKPMQREEVPVGIKVGEGALTLTTSYLRLTLAKDSGAVRVEKAGGGLLMADAAGPQRNDGGVVVERLRGDGEQFRGLGPAVDLEQPISGQVKIETETPFLISSLGYGEFFPERGRYLYRFGERRWVGKRGEQKVEYFLYYGPSPLEILEEHVAVTGGLKKPGWQGLGLEQEAPAEAVVLPPLNASWEGIAELLRRLEAASYSAILLPAVDLTPCRRARADVKNRFFQLATYLPVVCTSSQIGSIERKLREERSSLVPYLASYTYEAQDRGFPLLRPLSMQYPKDAEAARHRDQFMLGDELLIAPVVGPSGRRQVYLPMGIWTELHTNKRYQGRQTIEIEAGEDWIPVFARNGSIVPLASIRQGLMWLHYFPRLAAEFFLYERNGALTQLHAAPAGDLMRLEIETAQERVYEWVVHHVGRPSKVWCGEVDYAPAATLAGLRPGAWWHDADQNNLHIRTRAAAGSDHVIHVAF